VSEGTFRGESYQFQTSFSWPKVLHVMMTSTGTCAWTCHSPACTSHQKAWDL